VLITAVVFVKPVVVAVNGQCLIMCLQLLSKSGAVAVVALAMLAVTVSILVRPAALAEAMLNRQ
jgi:hypothetical protein